MQGPSNSQEKKPVRAVVACCARPRQFTSAHKQNVDPILQSCVLSGYLDTRSGIFYDLRHAADEVIELSSEVSWSRLYMQSYAVCLGKGRSYHTCQLFVAIVITVADRRTPAS